MSASCVHYTLISESYTKIAFTPNLEPLFLDIPSAVFAETLGISSSHYQLHIIKVSYRSLPWLPSYRIFDFLAFSLFPCFPGHISLPVLVHTTRPRHRSIRLVVTFPTVRVLFVRKSFFPFLSLSITISLSVLPIFPYLITHFNLIPLILSMMSHPCHVHLLIMCFPSSSPDLPFTPY